MDYVRTLKALADPLRLRVLAAVAEEELTVGEVQEVVGSVQSSVARNLALLREVLVGPHDAAEVVLLEIAPEKHPVVARISDDHRCGRAEAYDEGEVHIVHGLMTAAPEIATSSLR